VIATVAVAVDEGAKRVAAAMCERRGAAKRTATGEMANERRLPSADCGAALRQRAE